MTQIALAAGTLMFLVLIMSVGMIFAGRPLQKSCGGIMGGDKSECAICDGGENPDNCPD
jgi:hypothetical protein